MRKFKHVDVGDYVLITRYGDKDPQEPWRVGFISEYGVDAGGNFYKAGNDRRYYRHCWKISKEEGETWLRINKEHMIKGRSTSGNAP